MRLGGRLAAAIEVLDDIDKRHRPAADALKDWGLSHRFAGAGDRAAIGNIVYDGLRRRRSAGWLLDADTPRAVGFGALLLEWRETAHTLNEALQGDKFAPPPLSPEELQTIAVRGASTAPDAIRADCPDWCAPLLQRAFSDEWVGEGAALAARPPLDLRVNTLAANRPDVLAELAETGAVPSDLTEHGIRIAPIKDGGRHPNVQAEPAFRKGWFEVQDEGSQIAADLTGAEPNMQVLDYCAGAGGKALALSAAMENSGRIFAHDAEKTRLAPIFERIRRSESRNIEALSKTAELAALQGGMDIVLVDAPCTGSGTWRRRPDAKWRLSQKQLDARIAEQAAILHAAKAYVKAGGYLVYVTCSVFEEENRDQIRAFLDREAGFVPVDHEELWASRFAGHADAARVDPHLGICLSPAKSGTDGFFFAKLRRAA
jgi:16S rRNA (cytosine967-C5)-methyltransferase